MKPVPAWIAAALASAVLGHAHAASIDLGRIFDIGKDVVTAASGMSEENEIAVGREVAGRTLGAAPLVADPELQAYVNRVGRWVAAQTERPDLPWHFGVIDSPAINAFAAPGGYVLVTRGLYEILDNEAQLAGVLGHEISHITGRHALLNDAELRPIEQMPSFARRAPLITLGGRDVDYSHGEGPPFGRAIVPPVVSQTPTRDLTGSCLRCGPGHAGMLGDRAMEQNATVRKRSEADPAIELDGRLIALDDFDVQRLAITLSTLRHELR